MSVNYYIVRDKNAVEQALDIEKQNELLTDRQHEILASMVRFIRDVERNPERFLVKPGMPFFMLVPLREEIIPADDIRESFYAFKQAVSEERIVPKDVRIDLIEQVKNYIVRVDDRYQTQYLSVIESNPMLPQIVDGDNYVEIYLQDTGFEEIKLVEEIAGEVQHRRASIFDVNMGRRIRPAYIEEFINLKEELNYHIKNAIAALAQGEQYAPENQLFSVSYSLHDRLVYEDIEATSIQEVREKISDEAEDVSISRVASVSVVNGINNPIVNVAPEKTERERRMEAATMQIDEGFEACKTKESLISYLDTMANFPNYTANNSMLIHEQMPEATNLASYNQWRDLYGRSIIKGEKAIRLITPQESHGWIREVVRNSEGEPLISDTGDVVTRNVKKDYTYFVLAPVFDLSQTKGNPVAETKYVVDDSTEEVLESTVAEKLEENDLRVSSFEGEVVRYVVRKHFDQDVSSMEFKYISTEFLSTGIENLKSLMGDLQKTINSTVKQLKDVLPRIVATEKAMPVILDVESMQTYLQSMEEITYNRAEVSVLISIFKRSGREIALVNDELVLIKAGSNPNSYESTTIEFLIDEAIALAQEEYDEKASKEDSTPEQLAAYDRQSDTLIGMEAVLGNGGRHM